MELLMVWQLLQVRHIPETPLILVGQMWNDLVDWARTHLLTTDPPLTSAQDLDFPECVKSADEAIALLRAHHAGWLRTEGRPADASGDRGDDSEIVP